MGSDNKCGTTFCDKPVSVAAVQRLKGPRQKPQRGGRGICPVLHLLVVSQSIPILQRGVFIRDGAFIRDIMVYDFFYY